MTLVMKLVREREIIDREKYGQEYDRIFGVKPVSRAALPKDVEEAHKAED